MQIQATDLFIGASSVTMRVALETDDNRKALVDLTRSVETESEKVNLETGFVSEGSSDFTTDELYELTEYVRENSAILFSRLAAGVRAGMNTEPADEASSGDSN